MKKRSMAPAGRIPNTKKRIIHFFLLAVLALGLGGSVNVPRVQAAGATLKVSPTTGTYEVGSLVDIAFLLDTGGEAVNAIGADIVFPADKLQVVNPAASTSFISVWVAAPSYSNTKGTITLQGGIPNPGIKTSAGVVSTVTFRVISAGRAVIRYAPTSKVLRNDSEGTNILTVTGTADLTLKNPPPAGPSVSSPTHPDSNQWYNNPQIQFTWEAVDGSVGYSYGLDQNPKQTPDEVVDTVSTAASLKAGSDGIWAFHLRAKSEVWGGTTTYTVRIDSTPPAKFSPKFDKGTITIEESVPLRFITTDGAAGIDHYEVKQLTKTGGAATSDTLFVEASSPYTVSTLPEGKYEFIVRAVDRAGNFSEGTAAVEVVASGLPFIARVPILRNPAVANAALIILVLLTAGTITILVLRRVRIRSTFYHDLQMLERDAKHKAQVLQRELEEIRRAESVVANNMPPEQATAGFQAPAVPPPPATR